MSTNPGWIDLIGLANMRDLGGTPVAGGARIVPGRLIRSDNLQGLTEQDIAELVERRGVTDIIDLRSDVELELTGPGPLATVSSLRHHHHSLFRDRTASIDKALVLPWRDAHPQQATHDENHWADHYLGYLAARPDSVSGALKVIAQAEGAAVVHCAAGKDRTGTVVALALSVAGARDEDIVTDYLATTERIQRVVELMSATPAYAENLRGRPITDHHPDPEAIPRVLSAVRRTAGSVPGWLIAQGWSEDDVHQLRRRLTQP